MSATEAADKRGWEAAVGRKQVQIEVCEHESLRRFALAIGASPDVEIAAPALGHWAFFLPRPSDQDIGADGHPSRGGFMPAIPAPRRMFAAADIRFDAPLKLGEPAQLTSQIANIAEKHGRSGTLVFVEVDRTISQDGVTCVRERQSFVFRELGEPAALPTVRQPAPDGEVWRPEAVNLFRFSAATFNSHRIHYDLPYAREEEGYPALVVHGPFTASRLAELASRRGALSRFAFRAEAPLFAGQPIYLRQEGGEVTAVRCDGTKAMTAQVEYR